MNPGALFAARPCSHDQKIWLLETWDVLPPPQWEDLCAALLRALPPERPETPLQWIQRDIIILKMLNEYLLS